MCNDGGMTSSRSSLAVFALTSFAACTPVDSGADTGPLTTTTMQAETSGDGDGDPSGDGDVSACVSELDILFVIDNSGSMGEEQARIATGISAIIDPLDAAGVDWRIGVTTSDNGNEWCPVGSTTPEAGKLVLSPCTTRLNDFLFNNGQVDMQDVACNDVCTVDQIEVLPTPTHLDANEQQRPWVEKIGGVTNLGNGFGGTVDTAAALACLMPMGINGCGFESQLESMYLSLKRAENVAESEYGFLRPGASLLVVIISDEVDCSSNKSYAEIFQQDGNKVFWEDPTASFPTSAVCWNAGVSCSGDPSNYVSCDPVNKDVNGNEGVADADAVLHPMSRYLGHLDAVEAQIRALEPGGAVRVSLIAGVASDGSVHYAEVGQTDPSYQNNFGIGPGCTAPPPNGQIDPVTAVPPVRMRDVSTQTNGTMNSICEDEYGTALAAMVEPFIAECGG
jgi:hypothetical protein